MLVLWDWPPRNNYSNWLAFKKLPSCLNEIWRKQEELKQVPNSSLLGETKTSGGKSEASALIFLCKNPTKTILKNKHFMVLASTPTELFFLGCHIAAWLSPNLAFPVQEASP